MDNLRLSSLCYRIPMKRESTFTKNNYQRTPEDMAREIEHKEIVELLEVWTELKQLKTIEANIAKLEAEKARLNTLKRKYFN